MLPTRPDNRTDTVCKTKFFLTVLAYRTAAVD
jgi:hypothetical protein